MKTRYKFRMHFCMTPPNRLYRFSVIALILSSTSLCQAITILSGPTFTPSAAAPLAGVLSLTTANDTRVSVSVNDGSSVWTRAFHSYGTTHAVPLLGFKPDRTNVITVTLYDKRRSSLTAPGPVVFVTDPLPADFPRGVLVTNIPAKMEPGYTLFKISKISNRNLREGYLAIVDDYGRVVWYSGVTTSGDVRQLENGDLFSPKSNGFDEYDMLGNLVRTWSSPDGYVVDTHDGVPTDHGSILFLNDATKVLTNFPASVTGTNTLDSVPVIYCRVVEISMTNSELLNVWSPIDVLDPYRITYLTFSGNPTDGYDIEHANAVLDDPRDDSIIVSMRHQNAVIKFSRSTGQLKWILGPHANWGPEFQQYLLTPVGTPFEWNYGQHAPMITPQGTLLVYDNGIFRATPPDPPLDDSNTYSRAVEYAIDETNMTVSQVWDYGRTNAPERMFTPIIGDADWLTNSGNVLVTFGWVSYLNGVHPNPHAPRATMVRIQEVTHDPVPEVVFDLEFFDPSNTDTNYVGFSCYRSDRIPDLYAHLPEPVEDLALQYVSGIPLLTFSADATRTYHVQSSTDMKHWQELGEASLEDADGDFAYVDLDASASTPRFYRVVTM